MDTRIATVPVYSAGWIKQAREMLEMWRDLPKHSAGEPLTRARRKSLERLAKDLDDLDPADRLESFDSMRAAVAARLRSKTSRRRGRKPVDFHYDMAILCLVRAWEEAHGCSPLTHWKKFQAFASEVTKDYGAPVPGEKTVRYWVKGSLDLKRTVPTK